MKISHNNCKDEKFRNKLKMLKEKEKLLLKHKDMKLFLSNDKNKSIFFEMLNNPTPEKLARFSDFFKDFYRDIWIKNYLHGLIRQYSIDYDKKTRKHNQRYPLILDKPVSENNSNEVTLQDTLIFKNQQYLNTTKDNFMEDQFIESFNNIKLINAIKQLKTKEVTILKLYYLNGYTNKEIAKMYNQTDQNISYWHKKTLKKLAIKLNYKEK